MASFSGKGDTVWICVTVFSLNVILNHLKGTRTKKEKISRNKTEMKMLETRCYTKSAIVYLHISKAGTITSRSVSRKATCYFLVKYCFKIQMNREQNDCLAHVSSLIL